MPQLLDYQESVTARLITRPVARQRLALLANTLRVLVPLQCRTW